MQLTGLLAIIGRPVRRSKSSRRGSASSRKRPKNHTGRLGKVAAQELLRANAEELALSLSMMQATLDSTTDAIVVTDLTGNVRNFNEKYCEMMGVTREQLKKTDVHKLRLKFSRRFKDPEGFVSRVMEIYRTAPPETFEVLEWKDGTVLERYSKNQLLNQKPVGRVWSFRDVTARKRADEILEAAKIAAEQANQAKDDFLASLSHELRTPLMPAMIAASYLSEHQGLPPEFHEEVGTILRNVRLEAQLIDDLLDVTRITRGKIEVHHEAADVHRLLQTAAEIAKSDIVKKEIKFAIELGASHHHVWADPVRIQQVFWNLINNAVKFTPKKGRITIRSFNKEKQFVFEISDTGIGIEPERQANIFEPFHQGERSITRRFGGLGLGLTISKTLLDLHGGTITVESAGKNKGTTFRVFLTVLPEPVAATLDGSSGVLMSSKKLRLLLVDDHPDTRSVLSRLLTKTGHEVVTADSAKRQSLKGIALSGLGMEEDIRRSAEAGFDHHLTKPVNFQELQSLLEKILS